MAAKQLYQLHSPRALAVGAYVAVNGPWDKFGRVQAVLQTEKEGVLHLIRGCDAKKGERPCHSF